MNFEAILNAAYAAAAVAAPINAPCEGACGFAWVTIEGTSPLARYCRKAIKEAGGERTNDTRRFGSKGYPTGWQFWKPGAFNGQSVDIHEAGARAFRDELAKHGIRADVGSRLD